MNGDDPKSFGFWAANGKEAGEARRAEPEDGKDIQVISTTGLAQSYTSRTCAFGGVG